jgi:hypothetical protein
MTQVRRKSFGLSLLAVLGLMLLGVSSAQAANEFLLLNPGKTFAEEGIKSETFEGELEGASIQLIVPKEKTPFEITCASGSLEEGSVQATVLFTKMVIYKCDVYEISEDPDIKHYYHLVKKLPCEVTNNRSIEMLVNAVPVLHESATYLLFKPLEFSFATISYNGILCPLKSGVKLNGSVVSSILQVNTVDQLFGFTPNITLLWQAPGLPSDKLLYGEKEAYLEGSFYEIALNKAYLGKPWGAH